MARQSVLTWRPPTRAVREFKADELDAIVAAGGGLPSHDIKERPAILAEHKVMFLGGDRRAILTQFLVVAAARHAESRADDTRPSPLAEARYLRKLEKALSKLATDMGIKPGDGSKGVAFGPLHLLRQGMHRLESEPNYRPPITRAAPAIDKPPPFVDPSLHMMGVIQLRDAANRQARHCEGRARAGAVPRGHVGAPADRKLVALLVHVYTTVFERPATISVGVNKAGEEIIGGRTVKFIAACLKVLGIRLSHDTIRYYVRLVRNPSAPRT